MLRTALLVVAVVAAAAPAAAVIRSSGNWAPTMDAVRHVEAMVHLPGEAKPMNDYIRFYAGVIDKERKIIEGIYLSRSVIASMGRSLDREVNIVDADEIPYIQDGGCLMVTVYYDVESDSITQARCNGFA